MNNRERLMLRYLSALDQGDFETLNAVLKQAELDPTLDAMIRETHNALEAESVEVSLQPHIDHHDSTRQFVNGHRYAPQTPRQPSTDTAQNQPRHSRPSASVWTALVAGLVVIYFAGLLSITTRDNASPSASPHTTVATTATPPLVTSQPNPGASEVITADNIDRLTLTGALPRLFKGGAAAWIGDHLAVAEGSGGFTLFSVDGYAIEVGTGWRISMDEAGQVEVLAAHGNTLAAGYSDGRVLVWYNLTNGELASPETFYELPVEPSPVRDMALDENVLLVVYDDRAMVYDVITGDWRVTLMESGGAVGGVIDPQGKFILAFDAQTKQYNSEGLPQNIASIDREGITSMTTQDASIALGFDDGSVRLMLPDGAISEFQSLSNAPITALTASGEVIIFGQSDGNIGIIQGDDPDVELVPHLEAAVSDLALSPDGTAFAATYADGMFVVYDTATREPRARFDQHVYNPITLAYAPDSPYLAVGEVNGVTVWDMSTLQQVSTFTDAYRPENGLIVDNAGGLLLPDFETNTIRVWDDGVVVTRYTLRPNTLSALAGNAVMAHSPQAGLVAVGQQDGDIQIIDEATSGVRHFIEAYNRPIGALAFSPDGALLVAAARPSDGAASILVWNVITQGEIVVEAARAEHLTEITNLVFSPSGRHLMVGGFGGWGVLDLTSGTFAEAGVNGWRDSITFSANGDLIAYVSGPERREVMICETEVVFDAIADRREIPDCPRKITYPLAVTDIAFSTDGRILTTASAEGIRLLGVGN